MDSDTPPTGRVLVIPFSFNGLMQASWQAMQIYDFS